MHMVLPEPKSLSHMSRFAVHHVRALSMYPPLLALLNCTLSERVFPSVVGAVVYLQQP